MTNQYPNQNAETPPDFEARRQLAEQIVLESTGSVAVFTSADFDGQQKAAIVESIHTRTPDQVSPGHPFAGRFDKQQGYDSLLFESGAGGWGDYGERPLHQRDKTEMDAFLKQAGLHEAVAFLPADGEDSWRPGHTKVVYGFTSNGYTDGSARPNNALTMSFVLPTASAELLRSAVTSAPDFMNDVLDAQAAALGYTTPDAKGKDYWSEMLRPRFGLSDGVVKAEDRKLGIVGYSVTSDIQEYGAGKTIDPVSSAPEQVEAAEDPLVEQQSAVLLSEANEYIDPLDYDERMKYFATQAARAPFDIAHPDAHPDDRAESQARQTAAEKLYLELLDFKYPEEQDKWNLFVKKFGEYASDLPDHMQHLSGHEAYERDLPGSDYTPSSYSARMSALREMHLIRLQAIDRHQTDFGSQDFSALDEHYGRTATGR